MIAVFSTKTHTLLEVSLFLNFEHTGLTKIIIGLIENLNALQERHFALEGKNLN